jgi:hypothetical protein
MSSVDALFTGREALEPGDHPDALVAQLGQVLDEPCRGRDVLRGDLIELDRHEPVDENRRHGALSQQLERRRRLRRGREDDAVDPTPEQIPRCTEFAFRVVVCVREEQRVPGVGGFALDCVRELGEVRVRDGGHRKSDRSRPPCCEGARDAIVGIAGGVDRLANCPFGHLTDLPRAVHHV